MSVHWVCRTLLRPLQQTTQTHNVLNGMLLQRPLLPLLVASNTRTLTTSSPGTKGGKLAGKVAILTGSTEGIGLAMARRLAEDGASVVVSSRKQENVDKALAELHGLGLTAHGLTCHVGNTEDLQKLVDEAVKTFGGIDIMICNAAVNPVTKGLMNCPESAWDKVHNVNLKSPFLLTKMVVPHMRERKGGVIVYVTSNAAYITPWELGAYCVSKTGLLSLMKMMSQELAPDNIRVNCFAPGFVKSKFGRYIIDTKEFYERAISLSPMKRFAEPHEMGGAASFLCSDDSSFMTGETLVMTGGMYTRL